MRAAPDSDQDIDRVYDDRVHDVQGEQGFTVLEALIAIALLAAAFIPLLEIQTQFVRVTEALDRTHLRVKQEKLVHNFLSTVNYDLQPTGSIVLNNMRIQWRVEEAIPTRFVKAKDGADDRYTVTYYDIYVTLSGQSESINSAEISYTTQGLGWTPTQSLLHGL